MSEKKEAYRYEDLPEWMHIAAVDLRPDRNQRKRIITVDGAPSSGKTTVSAMIAERFGIGNVTTGMMYCARGLAIRKSGENPKDADTATQIALEAKIDFDLSNPWMTSLSLNGEDVSGILFDQANKFAATAISDRREIVESNNDVYEGLARQGDMVFDRGSTLFPYADLKIWLTADPYLRAHRRHEQLMAEGKFEPVDKIRSEHRRREERDAFTKLYAPSIDSLVIDTTEMSLEDVFTEVQGRVTQLMPA